YPPIRERAWQIAVLVGILIAAAGSTLAFIWSRQHNSLYRQRQEELRRTRDELEIKVRERTADLVKANRELRLSEEYFRRSFDQGPIGAAIVTLDYRFQRVNAALSQITGYAEEELVSLTVRDVTHPEDVGRDIAEAERLKSGEIDSFQVETRFIRKNGEAVWINLSVRMMRDADTTHLSFLPMMEDITGRKRSEEVQNRLSAIVESSNEAIIGKTPDGLVTSWNAAAERIFGYSSEEIIGKSMLAIFPPELRYEEQSLLESVMRGERVENHETVRITKDGKRVHVSASLSPIRDASGTIVGVAVVKRDISKLKEAQKDLSVYMSKLEQSNKDLQDFAFVASHDLQEPLRKIQAFGERLMASYGNVLGDTGQDYIRRMQNAADRMQSLIVALLGYSRVTTKAQPSVPTDLNEVVREVLIDLETRIEQTRGSVEVGALPTIDADPNQMRQLFQNLIGNALKFHGDGEPKVKVYGMPSSENTWEIHVRDDGIGFDEKYVDRIFAPFQRLHGRNVYEGTGMGLAICRKIVERHGGTITARSRPDEGSTFIITLPLRQ
ncbi:MAG: sensor histidine kinase, partial [Acidobacteriota bacterium]